MRAILVLALLVCGAAVLVWGLPHLRFEHPPAAKPIVISQGPTVEKLERLSHLVTNKVYVCDVLIGEGEGCKGAWLIRGDAPLAINMGRAKITAKDEAAHKATIILPPPEVLQPRVDHERTKTWEVKRMAWLSADSDKLRDAVMLQAQRLVTQAANSGDNIEQAKRSAEAILSALYAELAWQITVTWAGGDTKAAQTK